MPGPSFNHQGYIRKCVYCALVFDAGLKYNSLFSYHFMFGFNVQ